VPIQSVTVRAEKSLPDAKEPIEGPSMSLVAKKPSEMLAKVVFVVDSEGRARARRVRTGIATDTELEIVDGLQESEKVVEGPYRLLAKDLKDGDWVKEMAPGKGVGVRVQGAG
jgi:HlyD family secretion protein